MTDIAISQCPHCQAQYRVGPDRMGRAYTCAKCGKPFQATVSSPGNDALPQVAYVPVGGESYPGDRYALVSLICGLLFFCWPFTPLAALVSGPIALKRTTLRRGFAIAGTILGGLSLILVPLITWFFLIPMVRDLHEEAQRTLCSTQLHSLGTFIRLYRKNHRNQYPPDLSVLMTAQNADPHLFICPDSTDTPAASASQLLSGGHCSYIYLGGQLDSSVDTSNDILIYEAPTAHAGQGMNMLFTDGHVEWFDQPAANAKIQQGR